MKNTNKILLTTVTTLTLLLNGCGNGESGSNPPPVVSENHAPVASQIHFPSKEEGETVNIGMAGFFSDPDGDTLTFSATGLPQGLSIDEAGVITGTIDNYGKGTYTVTVTADDGRGETASSTAEWIVRASYKPAGWYGKTSVQATASDGKIYRHSTAGIFGELLQSSDEQDQHDIPGYGAAILQVILLPEFSNDTTAGYFSEYKKYDPQESEKKVWTFQVKNQKDVDLSHAPISIRLEGVFDVKYKDENGTVTYKESRETDNIIVSNLALIDVDNQTEYTVAELQSANLTMDGKHTRTFKWVLGTVDSSDYQKPQRLMTKSASFMEEKSADTFKTEASDMPKAGGKFGLPPQ